LTPHWTAYVSALGTPIVALIAGSFGVLIAYRQWKTAQNRLKLDLFDRRFPVYQLIREFLASVLATGQIKSENIFDFAFATRTSRWLFNAAIASYLEDEVQKNAFDLESLETELRATTDPERRKEIVEKQRKIKDWFAGQHKNLDDKFSDFLTLFH
jgi:hypothetical protein